MRYEHKCYDCQYEWEEYYSIHADPPTTCPSCKKEGHVKRLISGAPAVRVRLGRMEKKEQIARESKDIERRFQTDEKFRANMVGEEKYNQQVVSDKALSDNLKQL